MEINHLLKKGADMIKHREYGNPVLEASLVLEDLLNVDRIYIYTHGKEEVAEKIADKFLKAMEKRSEGYPIQYITGKKEFMGLDFHVEEGVLIPRGDTEVLIEYILKYIDEEHGNKTVNILELGVGSGAISLAIAYYNKKANVYGVDLYDTPLKVANINKEKFKLNNVRFYKGDLFEGIKDLDMEDQFHIIVSNPPYICKNEIKSLQLEVKEYEPIKALDGGQDGLDFYRRIIPESKRYLKENGLLIFEIGYDQARDVEDMMNDQGFKAIEILKDLQGLDRVIYGTIG